VVGGIYCTAFGGGWYLLHRLWRWAVIVQWGTIPFIVRRVAEENFFPYGLMCEPFEGVGVVTVVRLRGKRSNDGEINGV